ncbi:MAG: tellurium resistance protein TerC [Campylobacterota bacterium]
MSIDLNKVSSFLIFISFLLSLFAYFINEEYKIVASAFIWVSFFISYKQLSNKKLVLILAVISFFIYLFSYYNSFKIDYERLFTVNQYLLTLLIGVSFLRLIATPKKQENTKTPKGKSSFFKTYFKVHLFGSIINMSSLIIVADKMYKRSKLGDLQIVLLTRAFSTDALWSMFFVAFAATITYAPNLKEEVIIINGLIMAFIGFLITYFEVIRSKKFDIGSFEGYPISLSSLVLPVCLAFMVLVAKYFNSDLKVILLIALFSFVLTFLALIFKNKQKSYKKLKEFVLTSLYSMKNEIALFLVAGVFGVLVGSLLVGLDIKVPFEQFNLFWASLLLAFFVILSFVGVHPIITIAAIGDFLADTNHTILATVFLISWSITVVASPFSGLNLTMISRYNLGMFKIFRLNILYSLILFIVSIFSLYILLNFIKL